MRSVERTVEENAGQSQSLSETDPGAHVGSRKSFAGLPQQASASSGENRAHERVTLRGQIELVWRDAKQQIRSMEAKVRNVSRAGALVHCHHSLPVGSFVRIRSTELYFLSGCARVQHCSRRAFTYHIGLKFYAELPARYH
ncbi:MAG TPA: PilZ domain-containing protein [Bryobacteraceae bacterium]|nr:PilZ domain-containing protein [Bryobacteraceae bacterium]